MEMYDKVNTISLLCTFTVLKSVEHHHCIYKGINLDSDQRKAQTRYFAVVPFSCLYIIHL